MADFILTTGADVFPGAEDTSGDDVIDALAGADSVHAGNGSDVIFGGDGIDTLYGDAGNDSLDLGPGPTTDLAFGGTGTDTVVLDFHLGNQAVVARFSTGAWTVTLDGLNGPSLDEFERMQVAGGNRRDILIGGNLDDHLIGYGGNDRLRGGGGDDVIEDGWGIYDADGGTGIDELRIANTNARDRQAGLTFDALAGIISAGTSASGSFTNFERFGIEGTARPDSITTGNFDDAVAGLAGRDSISLGGGNDAGYGGANADTIHGGTGNDTLWAGDPAAAAVQYTDRLYGGDGDDLLVVETHSPGALFTYAGAVFDGGTGTDRLEFETTNAVLDLTAATLTGIDSIVFSAAPIFGLRMTAAQVSGIDAANFDLNLGTLYITTGGPVDLTGDLRIATIQFSDTDTAINTGSSTRTGSTFGPNIFGGAGADYIAGSDRIETLSGGGGADVLVGRGGADTLLGGEGRDTILGGDGNDRIIGGGGGDSLFGASGGPVNKDIFVYTAATDSGVGDVSLFDVIHDFLVAGGGGVDFIDRFDVVSIDAKASGGANDTFSFIGTTAFSAEGQIRDTQIGLDTLIEFNIAGTSGAEMWIILRDFVAIDLTQFDFFL